MRADAQVIHNLRVDLCTIGDFYSLKTRVSHYMLWLLAIYRPI